jgi:hypothetical protein
MSQGYVGSAADTARIRRLEDERRAERAAFDAAQKARDAREGGTRLVGFAAGTAELAEHAFKQDTVRRL